MHVLICFDSSYFANVFFALETSKKALVPDAKRAILGRSLELSYLFDKFWCPSLRASNGMDLRHSVRKQSHVLGVLWPVA